MIEPTLADRLQAILTIMSPGTGRMALLVVPDNSGLGDSAAIRLSEADVKALIVALAKPTLQ